MGLILTILAFLVGVLGSLAPARVARADIQNDIFQVLCMPELDVLEVRELDYNGETVYRAIKQRNENLVTRYGIYSPRWNVRSVPGPDRPLIEAGSARFECSLSSGLGELTVYAEPLPQSSGHFSIGISLRVAGRLLVDSVPFVLCRTGGPIRRFVYNAAEGYFTIEGRFGGLRDRPSDATVPLKNDWRLFFVESGGISALNDQQLGWSYRPGALRSSDIDYAGLDYDNREAVPMEACHGIPFTRRKP